MKKLFIVSSVLSILFITSAHAQLVCTDIIPDTTLDENGDTYYLDLNNDGTTDFIISHTETPGEYCCSDFVNQGCFISPLAGCAIVDIPASINIDVTEFGDLVSASSSSWNQALNQELASENHFCTPFGCSSGYNNTWSGLQDKYAALRIKIGLDTLYGWVRMSVGMSGSDVTIKNYAYNSVSGGSLHAGDTCSVASNINEPTQTSFDIFPNPSHGVFNLQYGFSDGSTDATVEIRNELGQVVFEKNYPLLDGLLRQQVHRDNLEAGMYNVLVHTGAQMITQKVLILQ